MTLWSASVRGGRGETQSNPDTCDTPDPISLSHSQLLADLSRGRSRSYLWEKEWPVLFSIPQHKSLFTKRFMTGQHFSSGHTLQYWPCGDVGLVSAVSYGDGEKNMCHKTSILMLEIFWIKVGGPKRFNSLFMKWTDVRLKVLVKVWAWTFELFWAHLMKSLFKVSCESESIILRKLKASLSSLWTSKTLKPKHFYETVFTSSISFLSSHNSIIINRSLDHRLPRCFNYQQDFG